MTTPPPWNPAPGEPAPPDPNRPPQPGPYQPGPYQPGPYQPGPSPAYGPPTWDPAVGYPAPGQVPGGPWHVPAHLTSDDPLVNPPHAGFDGWFRRVTGTVRRSWRPLLVVLGLTHVLPSLVAGAIALALFGAFLSFGVTGGANPQPLDGFESSVLGGALVAFVLVFVVVVTFAQALGYAAATWVVAREAAGQPAPPGAALRYGLTRLVGLWAWTLLFGLIVVAGLCLCILPGIYLGFALALFGPVYVFEGANPLGRAWRMFHDNFGPVLGRLALLAALSIVVQVVIGLFQNVATAVIGGVAPDSTTAAVVAMAFGLLGVLLTLPVALVHVAGLVVTYAEQRARQGPLASPALAAELG